MAGYFYYPLMLLKQLYVLRKDKTLCFADTGWKLTLPKKFEILSEKQIVRRSKKTEKVLDMILERKVQYPKRALFFTAHYQIRNTISCSIAMLNELPENDWNDQNEDLFNNLQKLYKYRYREFALVTIQTERGARQKDNVVFTTRDIFAATPTRELYRARLYSTVYKNFGILVTMAFSDENIGEEMLEILRKSTFE